MKLLTLLKCILKISDSCLKEIEKDEPLSKFLHSTDDFNNTSGRIYPSVFKPSNKYNNISVYRTKKSSEDEIWWIAYIYVTRKRSDKKKMIARAIITLQNVLDNGLKFNPDGKPHPRHANIDAWPTDKEELKDVKVNLANVAELKLKPS